MKHHIKTIVALLATLGAGSLFAQSAAPTTGTADSGSALDRKPIPVESVPADEPVVLTPFEVSSTKDTGYQATDTLAGTRIRTNLGDVAASISVVDKAFMEDIGGVDQGSILQYTTNAQVSGMLGTYAGVGNTQSVSENANLVNGSSTNRVRGLASADNARDYFITDIPFDSFDTDRIDILRGPNSILYGLGSPAGIVNTSLRSAEFRNFGEVKDVTGSYGSQRATVDVNEQLIKNVLAIRVDTLWNDQLYEQTPAFQNQKRVYLTARYDPQIFKDPSYHTSIKVKFENGEISADRPRSVTPNDDITSFWKPTTVSASNPFGGEGGVVVNNPYDPYKTTGVVAGNGLGLLNSTTVNYNPYISSLYNVQQPYWAIDGNSGSVYGVYGGYINTGAINSTGALTGVSSGIVGLNQSGQGFGIVGLPSVAAALNLPNASLGLYKNQSLQDSSIFNFYDTLIDGPTSQQWENWSTHSLDISQTALNDRVGIDVSYDRQKYNRGGQFLIGTPTISVDLLRNMLDFYTTGANGTTSQTNPNYGRPFVEGAGNNGGSSYYSDHEYKRADLFAEFRASDFTQNDFLVKLLGRQVFNGVLSNEKYQTQNESWQMYANSQAWDGYWNGNAGNTNAFTNRPPGAVIYLGAPVLGASSPNGLNIPGITSHITLSPAGVYNFNSTYQNYSVPYGNTWSVPSSLSLVYSGIPNAGSTTQLYQASNPSNMVGWSTFQDNILSYNLGQDDSLLTLDEKQLRVTNSYAGSYQGYWWKNAIVTTFGWRFDEVKTKGVIAQQQPSDRNELDLEPQVFTLPGNFPAGSVIKGHSRSGGLVIHLNDFLPRDPLPFNLGLTFNDSSNFQVTGARVDVYGNNIPNPTGQTREFGGTLSTKNNKLSLRVVKYDTLVQNGAASLGNPGGLGSVVAQGLRWRNVFLYQLGGYTFDTANQPSYRNTWTNAYPALTGAQAQAQEDAAITGWNNIQTYLASKNFFPTWNFTPTGPSSALVNETTYLGNPGLYTPTFNTVSAYVATAPQGFTVTSNQESKGFEFDLTANPLSTWRISLNASEATAVQSDVGGPALTSLVNYLYSQMYNADGSQTPVGLLPQFGSAASSIALANFGPWYQNYQLLKLQEGASQPEISKWRFSLINNYTFNAGFLNGVGVGGGYRWQAPQGIGYPVLANGQFDISHPYYGPSLGYVDLWTSYSFALSKNIGWKVQFNVTNVGKRNGLIPVTIEPDGHTWATVRVAPVEQWQLANTLSF